MCEWDRYRRRAEVALDQELLTLGLTVNHVSTRGVGGITQPYDSIACCAGIQYQTYRSGAVHGSIAQLRAKPHVSENNSATARESRILNSGYRVRGTMPNLRKVGLGTGEPGECEKIAARVPEALPDLPIQCLTSKA